MRHTHTCPKCSSSEIFISKGRKNNQHGNKIVVTNFKMVPLDHYVCLHCGYTEEWVTDQKGLEFLRRKASQQKPRGKHSDFV